MKYTLPIIFIFSAFNQVTKADIFTPSHYCTKPYGSYSKSAITNYRNCISDFVDDMNRQAQAHANAASDAVSEWNSFANSWNY